MKSPRNKTIDIPLCDGGEYLSRCQSEKDISDLPRDMLFNGNTFDILPKLPHGFANLLIADPPYNLTKNYNGRIFGKSGADEYREYTRSWLEPCLPLLKKNSSVYVCCDWQTSLVIGDILGDYFNIRNRITWQREKGRGASKNWKNCMEDIWFATLSEDYTFNLDAVKVLKKVVAPYRDNGKPKDWQETENGKVRMTCPSNFWDDITVPYWSMAENTAHPTQKPEKLIAKLILASSNAGDMILDPFAGSGTTEVTAKKLGRHFCGIELDREYCIWAQKRLALAETDNKIQGFEEGVFKQRNT